MIDRLQASSRLLIRASLAIFTAVVLLLIQSAFWSTRVSGWMQAIIVATALLSYFRPQYGLLALAALVPLGQVGSRTLDSSMRGAESLVLAFLAGALVRGWTLREFRNFPSTRLEIAALVFGFIVAASCVEQLWLLQIQRDFPWPFAQEVFGYASRNYLGQVGRFRMIFHAMLLLEGVALLVFVARYARREPPFGVYLIGAIVIGAAATSALTLWHVAAELIQTGVSRSRFLDTFIANRWTVHIGDVNAAGSFFAMGMFIAIGMAAQRSRHRLTWVAATLLLATTAWMTHSRTALVAILLTSACLVAVMTVGRRIGVKRTLAITVTASIGFAVVLWHYVGPENFGTEAAAAVNIRWMFLQTTWRMLVSEPLFGLGIGQFYLWSHLFAPPELWNYYPRENAHNNFAQIAGELGLIGIAGFVAVLTASLWRPRSAPSVDIFTPPLLGVSAFMLTWLGGHPLLVPDAAYPFWITLGVAAAFVVSDSRTTVSAVLVASTTLLLFSMPFRVDSKSTELDLSGVSYGVSTRQTMTSRARFFVPATEHRVEFPLRARGASDGDPVEIEVFVDGSASQSITITNRDWQRARIELGRDASGRYRQIDLHIKPPAVDDVDTRPPVEVGNWEIISKPNG